MKIHLIKKPKLFEDVATPACASDGLVVTPTGVERWGGELQSHWHRSKVTCGGCKRTKLFRNIKEKA